MTIKQLIVKLDKLFHDFIVQTWKPGTLKLLAPLIKQVMTPPQMHMMLNISILQDNLAQICSTSGLRQVASICFRSAFEAGKKQHPSLSGWESHM